MKDAQKRIDELDDLSQIIKTELDALENRTHNDIDNSANHLKRFTETLDQLSLELRLSALSDDEAPDWVLKSYEVHKTAAENFKRRIDALRRRSVPPDPEAVKEGVQWMKYFANDWKRRKLLSFDFERFSILLSEKDLPPFPVYVEKNMSSLNAMVRSIRLELQRQQLMIDYLDTR